MKVLKKLTSFINQYFGLLALWVFVFFITVFLVSIAIQNWNLKQQTAFFTSEYLISA